MQRIGAPMHVGFKHFQVSKIDIFNVSRTHFGQK